MRVELVAAVVVTVVGAVTCGCSATGVSLQIGPGMSADRLDLAASYDGKTVRGSYGHGGLTMPIALFAQLPDEDTVATFSVEAVRDGKIIASGASDRVWVQRFQRATAMVTLSGPGVPPLGPLPDGGVDLAPAPPDLAPPEDLAGRDLVSLPPDLAPGGFTISHVGGGFTGSADVAVSFGIDTDKLRIDDASPPAGASFGYVNGLAVLQVGSLSVIGKARVSGTHALVVVAARTITIKQNASLDAGAQKATGGPGAVVTGDGTDGAYELPNMQRSSGGGGAGYGTSGGKGGDATLIGAAGGPSYGDGTLTQLNGGSAGGNQGCKGGQVGRGGGGGGALQLTARLSIRVDGNLLAGGGGGVGAYSSNGCGNEGGGGGGSGGAIFLESPSLTITAGLYANGGGGGGGETGDYGGADGSDGATACPTPAAQPDSEGTTAGGVGGCATVAPGDAPAQQSGGGGGGGGAVGRIVVRTVCPSAPTASPAALCIPIY